ncbi:MAG: hypothetical protein PWQ39_146 [Thermacetogenium sp.]|nr:hypothetical protein [Thermacetogenium sp.]
MKFIIDQSDEHLTPVAERTILSNGQLLLIPEIEVET